jgi:hypothetical protein
MMRFMGHDHSSPEQHARHQHHGGALNSPRQED